MDSYNINEIPVKIHGRTVKGACPLPLFWSRSGIEVNATGKDLYIDIEIGCDYQEPWFVTEINGCFISRQMLTAGRQTVCLYRNLTPGTVRNVRFYRDSQVVAGEENLYVLVHGVKTDGTFTPVSESSFKLEFVGDSITSGEGTYGSFKETDWRSIFMSSSRQYAEFVEKALNADCRVISHGGWGVYASWDNDIRCNIPSIYEKVCGIAAGSFNESLGAQEPYDFASWQPDAVIVNLGTNDASSFDQPPFDVPGVGPCKQRRNPDGTFNAEDIEKFKKAVYDFIKMIRSHNPKAHIVWAYGMLGYVMTLPICDAINRYIADTGDENVAFLGLPDTTPETVGSFGHPGVKSQERAAEVITEYLATHFQIPIKRPEGNP